MNQMSRFLINDKGSFINIIAGVYNSILGSATTFSPLALYNIYLCQEDSTSITFPNHWNTALLVIEGEVYINENQTLSQDQFAMFENGGDETFTIHALSQKAIILVMSGEPLNEPIAHYGPFLMNTQEELVQAFEDFKNGEFGNIQKK
jgi:redox-sensitive bicupin YhaK (pirin superfamily)